jgi:putative ABC transport system permease protein
MPSAHREAIDEIADHLNDVHRAALAEGKSPADADAGVEAELARMGPLAIAIAARGRKRSRRPESEDWRAGLAADVRHALKAVRLDRGFSATVILTLAIGIGACTTVFSFIDTLLIDSLPFPEADRLLLLWETADDNRERRSIVARPVYDDWRRETRSFASMGIFEYRTFNIASAQEPEQVRGARVSSSVFATLGVPPLVGRVFTDEEDHRQQRVAVISEAVWRAHLGADPSVLGKTLRLNGESHQIVGVMPGAFQFPQQGTGVWVPMAFTDQQQDQERGSHSFWVVARMAPAATFETARADVEQVGRALRQRYPENADEGSTATFMADQGLGPLRAMLTALAGAVTLVLVIACVNVANLQLGRSLSRRREFLVRLSLGANFGRLARQLFTESLVLAVGGGAVGVMLTWFVLRAADLVLTPDFRTLPYRGEMPIAINASILAFAAATALLSAALFGFAPLLGLSRREPQTLLREGERGSTGRSNLAHRMLVGLEVALAIVVLCGAGLLIKSLAGLMQIRPGFDSGDVLTMMVSLPQKQTYGTPERESFCAELSRYSDGVPGIRSVGATSHLPLSGANAGRALTIEGYVPASAGDEPGAAYRLTCPGYFATLGIPLSEGRDFTHRDVTRGDPVVIVNRAMAEQYWPGESPVGRRLKIGPLDGGNPWMTVVAVVGNVRHFGLDSEPSREIYLPYSQRAWPTMTIVAKTVGDPLTWQSTMKDVVKRIDPGLPVARTQAMDTVIEASVDWRETPMKLLTGFAVIGLALASIGVYGVLAYYVSQRTRELGLRAALGATRREIAALVVRQSLLPIAAGVTLGVAASLASGRWLEELLYQVRPGDPQVIAIIATMLVGVALLASWLPARRAASINPVVALRED